MGKALLKSLSECLQMNVKEILTIVVGVLIANYAGKRLGIA